MSINLEDLIDKGIFDVELNVIDPSITGSVAGDGTYGRSTDGVRWVKVGVADTDWEQYLITTAQQFETLNIPDTTDVVLSNNTLGRVGNSLVKGDGQTPGGVRVEFDVPTLLHTNTVGVVSSSYGDIPNAWASGNPNLTSISFGNPTEIGENAFSWSENITGDLIIPDSVTKIGSNAFYYCKGFDGTLTLPNNKNFTTIESTAFGDCDGFIGDLIIPDSVTTIEPNAFTFAEGFVGGTLVIPASVTSIGSSAFYYCTGLTQVDCYTSRSVCNASLCFDYSGIVGITGSAELGFTAGADYIGGRNVTVTLR